MAIVSAVDQAGNGRAASTIVPDPRRRAIPETAFHRRSVRGFVSDLPRRPRRGAITPPHTQCGSSGTMILK